MIRLRTFGVLELHDDSGRRIDAVLAQPKRLALLVYLAVAAPRSVCRRDQVLSVFWPDLDDVRARDALNQALRFLRQELGPDALVRRGGDEIGVAAERLWCDAVAFRDAIIDGRPDDALELYRGEFLNAFYVEGCRELEEWTERERAALRRDAADAARRATGASEARQDLSSAIAYAQRALALAPDDEPGVRRLMQLHQRAGDRAGALRAYADFSRRLHDEYGCDPSPETAAVAKALVEDQQRWTSPSPARSPNDELPPAASARDGSGSAHADERTLLTRISAPQRRLWRRSRLTALGALVAAVAILSWRALDRSPTLAGSGLDAETIAILPFRVTGADTSLAYLRDGMAELLAVEFTGVGGPRAIDPGTVLRAWNRAGPDRDRLPTESVLRLARDVGADQVLVGAVVGTPHRMTFTARIIETRTGDVRVPPLVVEGPEDSLAALLGSLSGRLLSRSTGAWRLTAHDPGTTSSEALRAFIAGRSDLATPESGDNVRHLTRALDIDSSFVLAAYWLTVANALHYRVPDVRRVSRLAWQQRERLGLDQRRLIEAMLGPDGVEGGDSQATVRAGVERVAETAGLPEAWHLLGDIYFHDGALLGYDDWHQRTARALARAVVSDTALGMFDHLALSAYVGGDTVSFWRWVAELDRIAPASSSALFLHYIGAVARGDGAALGIARDRFARAGDYTGYGWAAGVRLPAREADSLLDRLAVFATKPDQRAKLPFLTRMVANNAGQPARAREAGRQNWPNDPLERDLDVLGWAEGDSLAAERLARNLPTTGARSNAWRYPCEIALSRLRRGDTTALAANLALLRSAANPGARVCADLADALGRSLRGSEALAQLRRADSMLKQMPRGMFPTWNYDLAIGFARHRQWKLAAAAAHRRLFARPLRLAISLRHEARWAALAGDTATAIDAYRHYLVYRSNPEPAVVPQVDSVRTELARLLAVRSR